MVLVRVFVLVRVRMPVAVLVRVLMRIFVRMDVRMSFVRGLRVCRFRCVNFFREHVYFGRGQTAAHDFACFHSRTDIQRRRRLRK